MPDARISARFAWWFEVKTERQALRLPLAWGVNGFMSVVSAIVAPMVALSFGFGVVFLCGALAYAIALGAARRAAAPVSPSGPEGRTPHP